MTERPPLHPLEREHRQAASTLRVTVASPEQFFDDVRESIRSLEAGDAVDSTPRISFRSSEEVLETLHPEVFELLEVIHGEEPESIDEIARLVDRDVKNVHEKLTRLASLGFLYFDEEGQYTRPIVWFDEIVIELPFES